MVRRKKVVPPAVPAETRAAGAPIGGTSSLFDRVGLLTDPGQFKQPYAQHPWVHATVRCIARSLKGVPTEIKQGTRAMRRRPDQRVRAMRDALRHGRRLNQEMEVDQGQPVDDPNDPMVRLFERPNPLLASEAKLWEATALHLWLSGGCVWVKIGKAGEMVASPNEIPVELWPLSLASFRPQLDQRTMMPAFWDGPWGATQRRFYPYQMVIFRMLNPYDDLSGLAPLRPAGISAEADWSAMSFNAAFFQNGADPGGIIKTKANLKLDQARGVLDAWNDQHQGHRRAHRVAVLTGESEFVPNSRTQRDMEFGNLRDTARRELLSTLGPVPPILLGLSDDYTRATAQQAEAMLFHYTLLPEMRDIEDVLAVELGNWSNGQRWLEFDLNDVEALKENAADKVDPATKLFSMGVPLEQVNEILDLGIETERIGHAGESFLPGTLRLADDVVAGPDVLGVANPGGSGVVPAPGNAGGGPDKGGAQDGGPPSAPDAGADAGRGDAAAASSAEHERARKRPVQWHRFIRSVSDPAEAKGVRAFKRYVEALRKWTLAKKDAVVQHFAGTHRDAKKPDDETPAGPLFRLTDAMVEVMLFNEEQWDLELRRIMGPVYKDAAGLALKHLREELGQELKVLAAEDPRVLQLLAEKEIKVVQINDTIRTRLREVLMKAAAETQTVNATASEVQLQLGQALKAEFNSISGRSLAIARTETAQVANTVRAEAMRGAGVLQHEWVSANDAHVRESHKQANGEVRVIGTAFSNGLTHPGQMGAPAEEVINCRCIAVAVIPGATTP